MGHTATYINVHNVKKWTFDATEISSTHRTMHVSGYDGDGWLVFEATLYSNNDATWEQFQKVAQSVEVVS